jgi:DNA-binding XRE family transcriptional regulator
MLDNDLIGKIRMYKLEKGYTLHEMSKIIDIPISTLERWFKTGRINKLYAQVVKEKLGL